MAENSNIEWTDHTFNPWIGCQKVSPACDNCYAERWDERFKGGRWGPHAERTLTRPANWKKVIKWHDEAFENQERKKVFCASLADVFDNHKSIKQEWRDDLWRLIRDTPNLDWLLLTKRPQNISNRLPSDWDDGYPNVWIGTTVENQEEADRRIPHLLSVPATVHFLSCEPLLGPVDLSPWISDLEWIITGGESGPNCRETNPDWIRNIGLQCVLSETPFFFKQWGGKTPAQVKANGRELDGVIWNQFPHGAPNDN